MKRFLVNLLVWVEMAVLVLSLLVSVNTIITSGVIATQRSSVISRGMELATYSPENIGYPAAKKAYESAMAGYEDTLRNYANSPNPINVVLSSASNSIRVPAAIFLFLSPLTTYFAILGFNVTLGLKKGARA